MMSYEQENKDLYLPRFVYEQRWEFLDQNGRLPHRKKGVIPFCYSEKWFWGIILQDYEKKCKDFVIYKLYFFKNIKIISTNWLVLDLLQHILISLLIMVALWRIFLLFCARVINKVYRRLHNSRTLTDWSKNHYGEKHFRKGYVCW